MTSRGEHEVPKVPPAFWREAVVTRVRSLRTELETLTAVPGAVPPAATDGVHDHLVAAQRAAVERRRFPFSVWDWWVGAQMDRAWLNVHAADVALAQYLGPDDLRERIPNVLAHLKVMDAGNERRVAGERHLRAAGTAARPGLLGRLRARESLGRCRADYISALRWAHAYGDEQFHRLRTFRNSLIIATGILLLVVAAITLTGLLQPPWVPLCFAPGEAAGEVVCPTGTFAAGTPGAAVDAAREAAAADTAMVALFGLVGAVITAAGTVRSTSARDALSLRLTQALLKLPFGALVAIVGILFIQGSFVPGLSALDTSQQILAYAVVLGASQQLVTRIIDKQSETLLSRTPSHDLSAAPMSTAVRRTEPAPSSRSRRRAR